MAILTAQGVKYGFHVDAEQAKVELQKVNALCGNATNEIQRMNTTSTKGFMNSSSAAKNLALRFVGYNLVLNQLMGAQQKLVQYVTESVQKFREFQTRIAEVSTIMTGDYQPALEAMKSGIVSLSLSTGQATSDLTKGLYDIMSAAFEAKEAINLLNTATKASIAGLSDVRTSVDIFTTVLNSYGMSVYEATHVSDTLFQSVVRGKFQFEQLESALGYVVPIAAQAGIKFDELMAALSTATRHGLHLDMASRGLAMALQNIINPSEGAAKAAQKYGIELSGLALRIKGISGVFSELNQKTKEYGKIVLNEIVPNIRSLRVAMVLAGDEGLEGLLDDMDRLSVAAGRTEQAFNKIAETSQFASNKIKQQWEATQREVGQAWDEMALSIQQVITAIPKLAGNLSFYIPIIGPFISAQEEVNKDVDRTIKKYKQIEKYLGKKYIPSKWELPEERISEETKELRKKYPGTKWVIEQRTENEVLQSYLDLQQDILDTSTKITEQHAYGSQNVENLLADLEDLNAISAVLQQDFNRIFGDQILAGVRNLEDFQLRLEEIEFDMVRLEEELKKPITYGWGKGAGEIKGTLNYQMVQLKADQDLADVKYDIKMGLVDEDYQYKVLNADMQEAIRIIREHEKVTKQDTEAINLMNVALRKIQIEMLELQLVGMMKRRGLSRQEERRMKKLEIAAAKLRLENMKNTKAETASQYLAYEQAKQMIDEYTAAKEHESYILKYNYDQQIADLQLTIDAEGEILEERKDQWKEATDSIISEGLRLVDELEAIANDPRLVESFKSLTGYDITEMLGAAKGMVTTSTADVIAKNTGLSKTGLETLLSHTTTDVTRFGILKRLRGYQRGVEYVPETGLALIHRGETIGAAGKDIGGEPIVVENVNINVSQLADIGSPEKLAAMISVAINSRVLSKTGKTHYRIR